ncbi:MAG: GDSL-type esterase/lipase family protein [Fimbriimonas sp.]|nr:GDSL-type esterase/lipase family protein [Fimbriimonas sp.]
MLSSLAFVFTTQVSITPAHRMGEDWWKARHERCVEQTKQGGHELIFIGDSITQGWEGGGKATWDKYYAGRKAANYGFSGDRTEHVLWRMENGEIVGEKPKVAVMMIGTNNIGHGSSDAAATALGVKTIVGKLRSVMPSTKILLLGIFPRGATSNDKMRVDVASATSQFSTLADGKNVFFLDISRAFMSRDGDLWMGLMPDLLHPNSEGYWIWAKAMEPTLKKLLGE